MDGASDVRQLLSRERSRIYEFLATRGARNVRLFGSLARQDDDEASDVDLLDELQSEGSEASWLTVLGLSEELSTLLGARVDVVTERTLRPDVRERALAEAIPL